MYLTGSGTISIHEERLQISEQVESKTSQFEIVFNLLARFSTQLDCKTAVFFANASDGPYSNERLDRVKKRRGRMVRFTLEDHAYGVEDHAYGASRLPKTTDLQSSTQFTVKESFKLLFTS